MAREFEQQSGGGSQSESFTSGDSRYGCYQKGVNVLYPKAGKTIIGRVLPGRDFNLSVNDASFPTSIVPYRIDDGKEIDADTKTPGFSNWFQMIVEYNFVGRTKASFLSPFTLSRLNIAGADTRDPLMEIRAHAKATPKWEAVYKQELGTGKNTKPLLPMISTRGVVNWLNFDPATRKPEGQYLLPMSLGAIKALKVAMACPRPATQNPIGPGKWFDKYLLGDITDPLYGLMGWFSEISAGMNSRTQGLHFSQSGFELQGSMPCPIDPNTEFGRNVLAGRYALGSSKVLKLLEYQDIVNWAVEDGQIPYELIQEALGNSCAIPPRPANLQNTTFSHGAPGGPAAAPAGGGFNPGGTLPPQGQSPVGGGFNPGSTFPPAAGATPFAGFGGAGVFPPQGQSPVGGGFTPGGTFPPAVGGMPGAAPAIPAAFAGVAPVTPGDVDDGGVDEDVPYPVVRVFYAYRNGGTPEMTDAQINALPAAEVAALQVQLKGTAAWVLATSVGLTGVKPVVVPPVVAGPVGLPPSAGPVGLPPAAGPVGLPPVVAPAAGPVGTPPAAVTPPVSAPAASKLTPEEQQRYDKYSARAVSGPQLNPEEVADYGNLYVRANAV